MDNALNIGRGFTERSCWLSAAAALTLAATSCGGRAVAGSDVATEAEWRAIARDRLEPLPGAARLTLSDVQLPSELPWALRSSVPLTLGFSELVVTGLLRRRDVHFVERRRFDAAVRSERAGSRPPGAPAVGVSPGAELAASVVWVRLVPPETSLEVRLAETETGRVLAAERQVVPENADPVGLARTVVATVLRALDELGRLPAWDDPASAAAPSDYTPSGVPGAAVEAFLEGLAAEEAWRWERARRAYQRAAEGVGFFEADVALRRTARLRLGGTLGES